MPSFCRTVVHIITPSPLGLLRKKWRMGVRGKGGYVFAQVYVSLALYMHRVEHKQPEPTLPATRFALPFKEVGVAARDPVELRESPQD